MSGLFSPSEREQIRRVLGYPLNTQAIAQVTERCNTVQAFGSEVIESIRQMLRELSRLDQQIKNAIPYAAQTFSSSAAGTRQSPPGMQLDLFKSEARRQVMELSETLSLPRYRDIYGRPSGPAHTLR